MSFEKLSDKQALIPLMGKLMKELKGIMSQEFKAHGIALSKEQSIILKRLCDKNGQAQNDLALVTGRDKTSLTRLLSTMERKALIKRKQSAEDKRINLVFITAKGRRWFEKASPVVLNLLDRAIAGIEEEKIASTKKLLNDIYKNLNINHDKE